MSAKTIRLRCDLAGALSNALDVLGGEEAWNHPFRDPPDDDDRIASIAMLEMIRDHIRDLRAGKHTLADFADFYCLTPEDADAPTDQPAREARTDGAGGDDRQRPNPDRADRDALKAERDEAVEVLCSDCPPWGYSTDRTRCVPCPRPAPQPTGGDHGE